MTEDQETRPDPAPAETPPDAAPAVSVPASAPKSKRRHPIIRVLGILAAILAAAIVASLTIDLGPSLKKRAEDAGSKYLDRPMRMGKLGCGVAAQLSPRLLL